MGASWPLRSARARAIPARRGGVPRQGRRDPDIVDRVAAGDPGAVVIAGVAGPGTGRMLAAIDARLPGVPVYATSGMLERDPAADPGRAAERRGAHPERPRASCLPPAPMSSGAPASSPGPRRRGPRRRTATTRCASSSTPSRRGTRPRAGGRSRARDARQTRRDGATGCAAPAMWEGQRFALYALENGRFRFVRIED